MSEPRTYDSEMPMRCFFWGFASGSAIVLSLYEIGWKIVTLAVLGVVLAGLLAMSVLRRALEGSK